MCLCNNDSGIHKLYLMSVAVLVATELKTNSMLNQCVLAFSEGRVCLHILGKYVYS